MGTNRQVTRVLRWLGRYGRDRRGNISTLVALLIVPLVGVMGIATETGNWFLMQRSMQNAADSAVLAAATNANATNNSYQLEGKSVATKFGFTSGANNTTVTIVNNDNTVPAKCAGACYAATITRTVPVYLNRIVGWSATQSITAKAVALPQNVPTSYCLVSLGGGDAFHINGGNSVNLNGCNVLSNGDVTCNGTNSNGGANSITFLGNNKNCSPGIQASTALSDPYASLASNIPSNPCGGNYPQASNKGVVDAAHTLTGPLSWGAVQTFCGDMQLGGNVNLTTPGTGTVMVIYNGRLDLNGNTLQTLAGSGLTIIFSGTSGSYSHILYGSGSVNISAPLAGSGTWSGMAIYQDPALTTGVDMTAAGNQPTWNISGVIYVPKSNLSFSGTVNKANNGLQCFVLVDYTFQSNGTGTILENQSQCAQYGVTLPSTSNTVRSELIY